METTLPNFDAAFVGSLIPQKDPFVMVGKLYSYNATQLVSGFTVTQDNIFTENSIFKEPGLIEHMAQSVALHTGYQFYLRKETAPTGYIGSINTINIHRLPKLGEEVQTTVTILQEFAGITLVELSSAINGEVIATGQMKTVLAK